MKFRYRPVKSSCPLDEKVNEMCGNVSAASSKHKYIFLTSQLELQLCNYILEHAIISATMLEAQTSNAICGTVLSTLDIYSIVVVESPTFCKIKINFRIKFPMKV